MFDNPDAEQLHEQILEPSSVALTITVKPIIYSLKKRFYYGDSITEEEGNTPLWYCLFEVRAGKTGKDRAFMFSTQAFGHHQGMREGPQWEKIKQFWQDQYDYIRQYIGFMMLSAGETLVEQAELVRGRGRWGECDWDLLLKEAFDALNSVMGQYLEKDKKAREEKDRDLKLLHSLDLSWRAINIAMHNLVSSFMPLQGKADMNVGERKDLRFSLTQLERLRRCYKSYQDMWNTAASIADSKRIVGSFVQPYTDEKWEAVKGDINQVCQLPRDTPFRHGFPDDLLDELRPKERDRQYEPYQLAYVHASRECGFHIAGPSFPSASNWRIISDALQKYMRDIGEPSEPKPPDK